MTFPLNSLVALTASLLVGLALLGYVWARRQSAAVAHGLRLDVSLPPAAVVEVAAAGFAASQWSPVSGDGSVNMAHVRPGGLVVSVEAVEAVVAGAALGAGAAVADVTTCSPVAGGSEVHIWMSGWTLRAGIVQHARLARSQMAAVQEALVSVDASYAASPVGTIAGSPLGSPSGSLSGSNADTTEGASPRPASRGLRAARRLETAQGLKHTITA